ncbi:hypothetical protein IWX90DRAFT_313922 [Phyllosticta citrichinensis]|uniref:Uncharacterized protein n=1 Tax=Phyllosticta citrichinensis TaxID=1130410 RepID=A0ABR1XJ71_9PEZI
MLHPAPDATRLSSRRLCPQASLSLAVSIVGLCRASRRKRRLPEYSVGLESVWRRRRSFGAGKGDALRLIGTFTPSRCWCFKSVGSLASLLPVSVLSVCFQTSSPGPQDHRETDDLEMCNTRCDKTCTDAKHVARPKGRGWVDMVLRRAIEDCSNPYSRTRL